MCAVHIQNTNKEIKQRSKNKTIDYIFIIICKLTRKILQVIVLLLSFKEISYN